MRNTSPAINRSLAGQINKQSRPGMRLQGQKGLWGPLRHLPIKIGQVQLSSGWLWPQRNTVSVILKMIPKKNWKSGLYRNSQILRLHIFKWKYICRAHLAYGHQWIHPALKTSVWSEMLSAFTIAESTVGHVLHVLVPLGLPDEQLKSVGSIHLIQTHTQDYQ